MPVENEHRCCEINLFLWIIACILYFVTIEINNDYNIVKVFINLLCNHRNN